jgi:hypothetical protein
MKIIGKVLFGVSLFLLLWVAEASAAWVSAPYYAPYPYAYTTVALGAPSVPYAYYVPAPVYRPVVTYVPRAAVYTPAIPVYGYPQVVQPWTYWTY